MVMWGGNITWLKSVSVMLYKSSLDLLYFSCRAMSNDVEAWWGVVLSSCLLCCLLGLKTSHGGWVFLFFSLIHSLFPFYTCLNMRLGTCFYLIPDSPSVWTDNSYTMTTWCNLDLISSSFAFLSLSRDDYIMWDTVVVFWSTLIGYETFVSYICSAMLKIGPLNNTEMAKY